MELNESLHQIETECRERFESRQRIKSFKDYLRDFGVNPYLYLRTAPQYCVDMFHYFGQVEVDRIGVKDRRWKLFDAEYDKFIDPLVGQERVQNDVYRQLVQFARRGRSDKMLLLHGPNGSSKSTTIELILRGLEKYSTTPDGMMFSFNWIFAERDERSGKIGFEREIPDTGPLDSYARLKPKQIAARIPCELKDSPLFLIPRDERLTFIEDAIAADPDKHKYKDLNYDHFLSGNLCPKCKKIYEALLAAYQGDWREVVRHVQVERHFVSKRYRMSAISIEPQGNIDASSRPATYEPTLHLPNVLQGVSLIEATGDLIEANHGVVEYSDFLKRPLETNKYLLTTVEKSTIHLQNYTGFLDVVFTATANEKHLSLFKRTTDFASFKGRIELISVPYLLMYSKEAELYQRHIKHFSRGRHVTPHTARVAALWAALTRLRRPQARNYGPDLAPIVARLTPLEKVMLYDHGELPLQLKDQERKLLRSNLRTIRDEHTDTEGEFEGIVGVEYEGRRGASAREMMSLLADAAENRNYSCLTPMSVFEELEHLVKDTSIYEFLRQQVDNGYNDCPKFIEDVKRYYLATVTQEVYDSIGLVDDREYERIFEEYFHHVKAFDLGEKLFIPSRGEYVEPSEQLMGRIEGLLSMSEPLKVFRSNLITKIAAYSIDHRDQDIKYDRLFPDIYDKLKRSFYNERDRTLTIVEHNILRHGTNDFSFLSQDEQEQVLQALERMRSKYGYCVACAKDVIAFVLRSRQTS
ncbi:MAG: serine protein kinase PrkA [Planctomycetota bacterium]